MEEQTKQKLQQIKVIDYSKQELDINRVLCINLGLLGHVDSGKTAIAKALSTVASTSSFDKGNQEAAGMTIELGFSAFIIKIPAWFHEKHPFLAQNYDNILFTIVDCPGHASLIKTVLSGASIIDQMILVIDINKGIQVQTAECIVVGQLLFCADSLIVALNKMDQFSQDSKLFDKRTALFREKVFAQTKFGKDIPMVPVSAAPRDEDGSTILAPRGIDSLIIQILKNLRVPNRVKKSIDSVKKNKISFLCAVDHFFKLKGKGCVLTGTILSGQISPGDVIQIGSTRTSHKIKGIQIFHKNVKKAKQGDRVGINISNLGGDSQISQRDLIFSQGAVTQMKRILVGVQRVQLYKKQIKSKIKFHITVGNQTVMGTVVCFFSQRMQDNMQKFQENKQEELPNQMKSLQEQKENSLQDKQALYLGGTDEKFEDIDMSKQKFFYEPNLKKKKKAFEQNLQRKIFIPEKSILIGSRFDTNIEDKTTRIAFSGRVIKNIQADEKLKEIKVIKSKVRTGVVQRIHTDGKLIVKDLFKKQTDLTIFNGMMVKIDGALFGKIDSGFGKSGKVKVEIFKQKLTAQEAQQIKGKEVAMTFSKIVFNPEAGIKSQV